MDLPAIVRSQRRGQWRLQGSNGSTYLLKAYVTLILASREPCSDCEAYKNIIQLYCNCH